MAVKTLCVCSEQTEMDLAAGVENGNSIFPRIVKAPLELLYMVSQSDVCKVIFIDGPYSLQTEINVLFFLLEFSSLQAK